MQNHKAKSPITKSGCLKMETLWVNYVSFHLELNAAHIRYIEVKGSAIDKKDGEHILSFAKF